MKWRHAAERHIAEENSRDQLTEDRRLLHANRQLATQFRGEQHQREAADDGGDRIDVRHYFVGEDRGMQRAALFDGSVGSGARPPRPRPSR